MKSRAWVEVRIDRLRENVRAVRRTIGSDSGLIPMVKAEAYGLGMVEVAAALRAFPAPDDPWAFGVAAVAEGETLRSTGWPGRILVFSPTPPQEYSRAADSGLTLCLSEVDAVRRWAVEADRTAQILPFHIEVDTGMGRAGFPASEVEGWASDVLRIAESRLRWEGIYTHFHSADEKPDEPTAAQLARFQEVLTRLLEVDPQPLVHVANSGAIFRDPAFARDLVRPGIYLYGGMAGSHAVPEAVVSVRSRITLVKEVEAGATAGYGATYTASGQETWGTLAIGYGDGIPRSLATGGGEVIVHGTRVPIIGRVSMDMITIDLTGVHGVRTGDIATLIGEAGGTSISLDEVAGWCGTISYEILTGLTRRLPRVYLEGEQVDPPQDY